MKTLLFTASLLLSTWNFAQEFSFPLYIEDAAGNKDTLILGYDAAATSGIDAQFGEVNLLSQAWEAPLDVRIGDKSYSTVSFGQLSWLTHNTYLSKKQILAGYCANENHSSRVSIQFHTVNYPIVVKWDRSLFSNQDSCKVFSLFFGDRDDIHFDALDGNVLAGQDSILIQPYSSQQTPEQLFVHDYSYPNGTPLRSYGISSYNDNGKEIGVLQFLFYKDVYLNSEVLATKKLELFPNPIASGGDLQINLEGKYSITDLNGSVLQVGDVINGTIKLPILTPSMYLLKIENQRTTLTQKISVF